MEREKSRRTGRSIVSLCLALVLLLTSGIFPVRAETPAIRDPRIAEDANMKAGLKATWDCVWFGSYPQSEVTAADGEIYTKLQNAGGWDANADVVIDGVKYRRKRKNDALAVSESGDPYAWPDAYTYHYFRYEPIKWRVLETNGNYLLLSDRSLDARRAEESTDRSFGWDTCTVRSWLNGYDAGMNRYKRDYTKNNFIDSAFSAEEKTAIVAASISSNGIDCKNNSVSLRGPFDTQDQVFFLSPSDVYDGDRPVVYGFHAETTEDEGRIVLPTTYALAMGAATTRYWYLRSVGWFGSAWEGYPVLDAMGADGRKRTIKTGEVMGVRPALYLNSFALERYSYAGTVCSDGTVDEKNVPMVTPQPPANNGTDDKSTKDDNTNGQPGTQKQNPSFAYTKTYNKTLGDKPFALESRLKTGDGSLSYKSSDPKVASISSEGKVTIRGTGICTITISASETANYNGRSVKATIQVSPKKAVLKTLKPGKKQLKVTWKKDTGADGYQIQYSTDKKFKKKTAVAVGKNKTTSRTIKKLTKGKRYYVRMRSYKKAKLNGKSKTLYGAWSKVQFSKKIK